MAKRIVLTAHAQIRLHERKLKYEWVEETAFTPEWTEPEPSDPTAQRRYRTISEFGGRVLRVVCRETERDIRIITAVFDRDARRKP